MDMEVFACDGTTKGYGGHVEENYFVVIYLP
jgi:hypothetical protein